jgi:nucleoside-diphosphate-sugar epimerase
VSDVAAGRRILVTGASGFVARHALAPLAARGFDVHAVARRPRPGDLADAPLTWHFGDLLDADVRRRVLDAVAPTDLLHAAWYLEPGKYTGSPQNLDWVAASIDLARAFEAAGGRRIVTVGTCFEYEHGLTPVLAETSPLRPTTVYGEAKQSLATALDALARATGLSTAWARLFYLYGPHEDRRRLIADIASSVLEGRDVDTGPGTARRDYMFIEDAGDALAALVASDTTGPVNIATGDAPEVRDLVSAVATAAGDRGLVHFGARPAPPDDPPEIRADVTRLRDEVGWSALTPQAEGVRRTVDWWRAQLAMASA